MKYSDKDKNLTLQLKVALEWIITRRNNVITRSNNLNAKKQTNSDQSIKLLIKAQRLFVYLQAKKEET